MADPQYTGGRAVLALIKRHREEVVTAMKRHLWTIVYIALHAIVFGAMFLPPLWIPNHGNGNGYEYHLWLAAMFPIGSGAMGILAAFFPVKRQVRLIRCRLAFAGASVSGMGWDGVLCGLLCGVLFCRPTAYLDDLFHYGGLPRLSGTKPGIK